MVKKIISLFLAFICVVQILPFSVFAEEGTTSVPEESLTEVQGENLPEDAEDCPEQSIASEATIVGEVASLREENVKHFRTSDGGYIAAVYNYPVHDLQNDEWVDLDMTLLEQKDEESGKNYYATKEQGVSAFVPEYITDGGICYAYGEHSISMSYCPSEEAGKGIFNQPKKVKIEKSKQAAAPDFHESESDRIYAAAMTLDNLASKVVYADADKNTDLEYSIATNGIKENIVVEKAKEAYIYTFMIEAGELEAVIIDEKYHCIGR